MAIYHPFSPLEASYKGYKQSFEILGNDRKKIIKYVILPLLCTTCVAAGQYFLEQKIYSLADTAFSSFLQLGENTADKDILYKAFTRTIYAFFAHRFACDFINSIEYSFIGEVNRSFFEELDFKVIDTIYSDGTFNLLKLTSNKKTKTFNLHSGDDLYNITNLSSSLTSGGIKSLVQCLIGLYTIRNIGIKYTAAPIALGLAYGIMSSKISSFEQHHIDLAKSKKAERRRNESGHIRGAKEMHSLHITQEEAEELKRLTKEINYHNRMAAIYYFLGEMWSILSKTATVAISYKTYGTAAYLGEITKEERSIVELGINKITDFFAFSNTSSSDVEKLKSSITSVKEAYDVMNKPIRNSFTKSQSSNNLIIDSAEFTITKEASKKTIKLPNMTFSKGDRCIIIGKSGLGKSTFISLLFGFPPDDYITEIKGKITLPESCNGDLTSISYIPQSEYIRLGKTFKECVYSGVPQNKKNDEFLSTLIREAGLEEEYNSDDLTKLSGGQRVRVKLITAILKKPPILLLDEAFSGLDNETCKTMRSMIQKHLKDSIILSVWHPEEGVDKSYSGFYSHQLNFDKKKITLEKLSNGVSR